MGSISTSHICCITEGAGVLAVFQYDLPVRSEKAIRPSAHTSVAGVILPPRSACSGDIQRGEPMACVCDALVAPSCTSLAMPKSSSLTVNSIPSRRGTARKMFSGLRSRWTRPMRWAAARAWQSCRNTSRTWVGLRWPRSASTVLRSCPLRSSMAIHGVLLSSSMPAATISTMWSLSMLAPARASWMKRSRARSSASYCACITLRARRLPVESCTHS